MNWAIVFVLGAVTLASCFKKSEEPVPVVAATATPTPTATPSCAYPVTSGLIARFDFSEGSGGSVADSSSYLNHGSISGLATWPTGKIGSGIQLDGSTSYTSAPTQTHLDPINISIEAWIYPTYADNAHVIVQKYRNSADGYQLWVTSDLRIRAAINSGGGDSSTNTISLNTWTHVVVTYDGSSKKLYLNGQLDATHAGTGAISPNTEALVIGQRSNTYFYYGIIDQVRLYSRALSDSEILQNYQATCN